MTLEAVAGHYGWSPLADPGPASQAHNRQGSFLSAVLDWQLVALSASRGLSLCRPRFPRAQPGVYAGIFMQHVAERYLPGNLVKVSVWEAPMPTLIVGANLPGYALLGLTYAG